jgi:hypothetical protein
VHTCTMVLPVNSSLHRWVRLLHDMEVPVLREGGWVGVYWGEGVWIEGVGGDEGEGDAGYGPSHTAGTCLRQVTGCSNAIAPATTTNFLMFGVDACASCVVHAIGGLSSGRIPQSILAPGLVWRLPRSCCALTRGSQ